MAQPHYGDDDDLVTLYFYELVNHISLIRKYIGSIVHQSNLAFHTRVREEEGERRCWQAASKTDPLRERGVLRWSSFSSTFSEETLPWLFSLGPKKQGEGTNEFQ